MFDDKILLITGGTGSFGYAVLRRLLNSGLREIRVFSRDEKKQEDMRVEINSEILKFYIGDVRDKESLIGAMRGVDYVFHAAALKQVPSCEFFPMEALRTNILGTENVLCAAANLGVKRVVVLSTDKAVYPINAMGMSKAMAEKIMVAKSREPSPAANVFCATRYGNVLASRGSVIPLFVSQIKMGKPLTITNPNMTRFLMTLEESVDLVIKAFSHGEPGDIFVQKSRSCTISDLAKATQEIFGKAGDLKVIGTRHGEKLFETLIAREEMSRAEDLGEYFRIPADSRDLNYSKYFDQGTENIDEYNDYTSHRAERMSIDKLKGLLLSLSFIQDALND